MAITMRLQEMSVSEIVISTQGEFLVVAGLFAWAHLKIVNVTEFYLRDMYNSKDIQVASQKIFFCFS